jgi:hypothetical protein
VSLASIRHAVTVTCKVDVGFNDCFISLHKWDPSLFTNHKPNITFTLVQHCILWSKLKQLFWLNSATWIILLHIRYIHNMTSGLVVRVSDYWSCVGTHGHCTTVSFRLLIMCWDTWSLYHGQFQTHPTPSQVTCNKHTRNQKTYGCTLQLRSWRWMLWRPKHVELINFSRT